MGNITKTKFRFKSFKAMERYFEGIQPHDGPELLITQNLLGLLEDEALTSNPEYGPIDIWYVVVGMERYPAIYYKLYQDKHLYK